MTKGGRKAGGGVPGGSPKVLTIPRDWKGEPPSKRKIYLKNKRGGGGPWEFNTRGKKFGGNGGYMGSKGFCEFRDAGRRHRKKGE